MYEVRFSKSAEKQFSRLDITVQRRVWSALDRIKVRPFDYVERLANCPFYKMRIGDYRVIMDIQQSVLLILVLEVGHRKNIYNSLGS